LYDIPLQILSVVNSGKGFCNKLQNINLSVAAALPVRRQDALLYRILLLDFSHRDSKEES
jgi:hypothetical protein